MTSVVARREQRRIATSASVVPDATRIPTFPLVLTAVGLAALLLRLYRLDREPLWLDEGYTLLFSRLPLDRLLTVGGAHEHPPLYYLIVHALLTVHDDPLLARGSTAVAGALCVVALGVLGSRLFGPVAGLVAAALAAASPLHVWYARDARAYEPAGLCVLLSYLCLVAALDRPRLRLWALYALITALALYFEYTAALVLLPQLAFAVRARRRATLRPLLLSWTATALLFAPWLGTLEADAGAVASNYWIPAPSWSSFATVVWEFLGVRVPCASFPCSAVPSPILPAGTPIWVAPALAFAFAILSAGIALFRSDFNLGVVTAWLLLPFILVTIIAARRSLFLDRTFIEADFPLFLLAGAAATYLVSRGRLLWVALILAALLAVQLRSLAAMYAATTNPDWRSATADFAAAHRPGQSVVYYPGVVRELVHAYLPGSAPLRREHPMWLQGYLDVPGWRKRFPGADDAKLRNLELAGAATDVRQAWLLAQGYSGLPQARHWFSQHGFHLDLSEIYPGGVRIDLFDRDSAQAFGPVVLSGPHGWAASGDVQSTNSVSRQRGSAALRQTLPLEAGRAYSVAIAFRATPPAYPRVALRVFDRAGRLLGTFPRTKWYDLPVNGAWLSQPFGFVAPPGTVRGVIVLRNLWGTVEWRDIAIRREAP